MRWRLPIRGLLPFLALLPGVAWLGPGTACGQTGAGTWALPTPPAEIVDDAAFSPDGRLLAAVAGDRTVQVWELPGGRAKIVLRDPKATSAVGNLLAFGPGGPVLAVAGPDPDIGEDGGGRIDLWDTAVGKKVRTLKRQNLQPFGLAFSPDGRWLAVSGLTWKGRLGDAREYGGLLLLWDLTSGTTRTLGGDRTYRFPGCMETKVEQGVPVLGEITVIAAEPLRVSCGAVFSPDGQTLAVGGPSDLSIQIVSVPDLRNLRTLPGGAGGQAPLGFTPDGRSLVCASRGIAVWDVRTGQRRAACDGFLGPVGNQLALGPGGVTLVCGGWDGTITLWDIARDRRLARFREHGSGSIQCLRFSLDGKMVAVNGGAGAVEVWDAGQGQRRAVLVCGREPR